MLYYTILYYTLLYSTLLYSTLRYCSLLYSTLIYYTIPYHTIPYYTRLYCVSPYYTILNQILLTILYKNGPQVRVPLTDAHSRPRPLPAAFEALLAVREVHFQGLAALLAGATSYVRPL